MFPIINLLADLDIFGPVKISKNKLNTKAKLCVAAILGDTLFSITALVIGILGLVGILNLPPAACYSCLAFSGFITLCWLVLTGLTKGRAIVGGNNLIGAKDFLRAAISSHPYLD